MKYVLTLLVTALLFSGVSFGQQNRSQISPDLVELWDVYQQIEDLKANNQDVPEELYNRYYELDRRLHPEAYPRLEGNPLDELSDVCPGILVTGPDSGVVWTYSTSGQTTNKANDCSYYIADPGRRCRYGRDVFLRLEVLYRDSITISTRGPGFDTYLCLWTGGCCADPNAVPYVSNDNNPELCGIPLTQQAGIAQCFDPGVYYICLDGATTAAQGAYRLTISFYGNSCIYPNNEPECPANFEEHTEDQPEGCDMYSTSITCGMGYCGQIDQAGDLDVYALNVMNCPREVTISVYADDTPGRTGFEGGLNSFLRIWPVTCEAPLATNNDFNGADSDPYGTDSQLTVTLDPGTYFFEVTGAEATSGPYEFYVSCTSCEQ
ncbi:MAG: hypothetical protein IPG71_12795 [bacterium]|nr:hypothetical protein [bacterium]